MSSAFNSQRFDALILLLCERCDLGPAWGRTKLAKMLYYIDFRAYRDLGRSMTGATYRRLPQGPVPKELFDAIRRLQKGGALVEIERQAGEFVEIRPIGTKHPDISLFSAEEMVIIEAVVHQLADLSGREVSDLSHVEPGWALALPGEDIPYVTALGSVQPPSRSDVDYVTAMIGV